MRTIDTLKIYEVPDLAAALGIHPVTARRYLAEGRIPARKLGKAWLVTEGDVLAMFNPAPARPHKAPSTRAKARRVKPAPARKRS